MSRHRSKRQRQEHLGVAKCVGCDVDISQSSYARIEDEGGKNPNCSHNLCLLCLDGAHASRSANLKLECPAGSCSRSSREWTIFEYINSVHRPKKREIRLPKSADDKRNHPVQYYLNKKTEWRKQHAILSVTTIDEMEGRGSNSYYAELRRNEALTDEDNVAALERIGRTLHPFLQRTKADKESQSHQTYANPSAISINQLEAQDNSPLRRFVHGLSIGRRFTKAEDRKEMERKPLSQKEFNASYAATETIRAAKGGGFRSSPLKNLVSDHLTASNVRDGVIKFFSSIGLCKSKEFIQLMSDKAVEEKIKRGWDPTGRGYGLIVAAYDNIGFRKLKGYVQYTLLSIIFYNVAYLISIGVYPDPTLGPDEAYESTKYKSPDNDLMWFEVSEEYTFEITPKDSAMLAREVTLPTIQFVLESMSEGDFPLQEDAKQFLASRTDLTFGTKVPQNATARRSVKLQENISTDTGQVTGIGEEELNNISTYDEDFIDDPLDEPQSMYSLNNVSVDVPMQQDLNCTSTIKSILLYYIGIVSRCLTKTFGCDIEVDVTPEDIEEEKLSNHKLEEQNPWAYHGWPKEKWPTPWMQKLGPVLCGDGQPSFGMLRLKEFDMEYQEKTFTPFNGGFHTMLELHKMRGKLFGPSHMRQVWKLWRPSDAQQNWVFSPGDPNQVDDEMIWYHFGMISGSILELWEELMGNDEPVDGISAIDVHEFMLKKAKTCAVTQVVLNELRYLEVVLLLHQAEEAGDAEKFVTALKFASTLITTTHATKYTFIHAKFLIWWHCASDAEKTIFEKLVMTKKTIKGKTIYTDRFVEWMVRDNREDNGKFHRVGTQNKLTRGAMLMDDKKKLQQQFKDTFKASRDARDEGDSDDNEHERITSSKLGKVFCETLVWCMSAKLWKATSLNRLSLSEDGPLVYPEMISAPTIGVSRMNTFIDQRFKNNANNPHDEAQQNKLDSELLRMIQPTQEKQKTNDELGLERAVSTTFSFVKLNYKLRELKVVYQELLDNWDADTIGSAFQKKGNENNKDQYTIAIIKAREMLISNDASWVDNRKSEIQQQIATRDMEVMESIGERLEEISSSLFCNLSISNDLRIAYSGKCKISSTTNTDNTSTTQNPTANQITNTIKLRRKKISFGGR